MNLSMVIPCYNEEGNVLKFFDEAESQLKHLGISYEYIFVNDGSRDKTGQVLENLYNTRTDKSITVVNFSRNFGKEAAIFAGLNNADGDYVCVIDADLQQHPRVAVEMLDCIIHNPQYDCICAYQDNRSESKAMSAAKSAFYRIMNTLTETEFKNGASDFRLFTKRFKEAVLSMGEYHRFSKGIFSWVGYNVYYMEYTAEERNSGETKWSFLSLLKYAFNGILSFSTAPLRIATVIGSISTIFSIVYLIVTVIRKLASDINVDGFTQIVILITFFSGVLLFTVGIIGEYIAKIYQQVKNRPIYIEKNKLQRK
ncbi:MAG: glycosyltransferase family 2 protein [Eubacterium sp.]